jgi:aconitate hydratase 2/2-methylisocitrate dehydratase
VVVLSSILGRTPTLDEYINAVEGINLTDFAPPLEQLTTAPAKTVPVRIADPV